MSPIHSLILAALVTPAAISAQQRPPRCDTPEFRQFDFWIGRWLVTDSAGNRLGINEVTVEEDGCIIHEHWTGARGGTGQSFNFYDRATGRWRQVWVSNAGAVLDLSGGIRDGAMAYTGASLGANGQPVHHRLTFFPGPDGSVRQLWETSTDGSPPWSVVFDGRYRKEEP